MFVDILNMIKYDELMNIVTVELNKKLPIIVKSNYRIKVNVYIIQNILKKKV